MINYYLLMKPGIILGNLVTFAAGFLLASKGHIQGELFFITLFGLSFIIASACVLNNYIDRHIDAKMERTKTRALPSGTIKGSIALLLAVFLAISGNLLLFFYTNVLTLLTANIGFLVYVCLYSFLKSTTTYSTLIGSIAGAIPPIVGYFSVSNHVDLASIILFTMMIFWQMPHFFSIAIWHLDDYTKAGIPLLPITKGIYRTKVHIILYILFLLPTVALFTLLGYTGYLFLAATTCIGLVWLFLSIKGFSTDSDAAWGRHMFNWSLVFIMAICFLLPLDLTQ